ncbi:tyrosine-type recombinase/integrase [Bradyrhizobium yuanmingense]|uniref:tyrosine-type recombinase/integrase n=1 Tax=Bradyrhizobium yuanmingense TaxID=108015 RepID=UPI0009EB3008|nr:tyrosine-type recombinase/integrase [Bradyrhizobium yuanmingense]
MSWQALRKRFLSHCSVERQLSENSLQAYAYDLNDFVRWLPARTAATDVTSGLLKLYLENMRSERVQSAATIRRRISCLRAFFRFLAEEEGLTDPFTDLRLKLPRRRRLPRALSREETTALLSVAGLKWETPRRRAATTGLEVSLMIATGIRVGELCKLEINDVSPDGTKLRIRGKGSRDRVVYVAHSRLRTRIVNLVTLRSRSSEPGPLFLNRRGQRLRPHTFRPKLRAFAEQAGVKRVVTPHMLRHTAATLLIESGVDIRMVQRLLGHSSIATTEIYTHVSDEALRRTLERANVIGALAA